MKLRFDSEGYQARSTRIVVLALFVGVLSSALYFMTREVLTDRPWLGLLFSLPNVAVLVVWAWVGVTSIFVERPAVTDGAADSLGEGDQHGAR
jgi:hypothetical protein